MPIARATLHYVHLTLTLEIQNSLQQKGSKRPCYHHVTPAAPCLPDNAPLRTLALTPLSNDSRAENSMILRPGSSECGRAG